MWGRMMRQPTTYPYGEDMHARWEAKVDTNRGECWEWTASLNSRGYSLISYRGGKTMLGHRYAYQAFRGEIPNGMQIDHRCQNKKCVNPDHLEVATPLENTRRGNSPSAINARRIECKHGHTLLGDNLIIRKDGKRACRECHRRTNREAYLRSKEAA